MEEIKKLKELIAEAENNLKDPDILTDTDLVSMVQKELDDARKKLAELESKTEKAVESAEQKVEQAETKEEKKEAQAELKEANQQAKEVEKIADKVENAEAKVEKVEDKIEEAKKKGRPKGSKNKASSPKKVRVPKGAKPLPIKRRKKRVVVKRKKVSKKKVAPVKRRVAPAKRKVAPVVKKRVPMKAQKMKSVRAFGMNIEYKNDAEFCKKLINAFKKRKKASKKGAKRRKTQPIFGLITTKISGAVSQALHSVPTKKIEQNPKQFLAKAQRLEKSAVRFLQDFKAILGSSYKQSEINSEFGELEKSIKKFVGKFMKK